MKRIYPHRAAGRKAIRKGKVYFHASDGNLEHCVKVRPWGADFLVTAYRKDGRIHEFIPQAHNVFEELRWGEVCEAARCGRL